MRRHPARLLTGVLLLTAAAGCSSGGDGGVASSPGSPSPDATGESSPSAAPGTAFERRPDDAEYVFHGARVLLPMGWLYEDYGVSSLSLIHI